VTRTVRAPTDADVPVIVALVNEATPNDIVDDAEVRTWLGTPAEMAFGLVVGDGGEPLAYVDLSVPESGRIWLDLRVPPRHSDDENLGAALGWAEELARGRGVELLRVAATPGTRVASFLSERGYRPIRHFFRMRIDLDAAPSAPTWPAGITVRAPVPGEERAVFDAVEAAFADHWEWTPEDYDEWEHHLLRSGDFDPALWQLACDGDEIAGVCICRVAPGDRELGWVRELGVRPPWRRRGLGTALLLGAFGLFWERGMRAVGLGVDGENTTGAVRLYESAGMRVAHRYDTYEKELT
jgi:mycothiol synthase